jgi:hypothetical protein
MQIVSLFSARPSKRKPRDLQADAVSIQVGHQSAENVLHNGFDLDRVTCAIRKDPKNVPQQILDSAAESLLPKIARYVALETTNGRVCLTRFN